MSAAMFPFSLVLILAGGACIAFGIRLALNLGGAADNTAAKNREARDPRASFWPPSNPKVHNYRPKTTLGMRRAGGLFVFVGVFFIAISLLLGV